MGLRLRALHRDFGVEILCVGLSGPVDDAQFAEVEMAVERHSVVLFRGQGLDDDAQLTFSRRFGALEFDDSEH